MRPLMIAILTSCLALPGCGGNPEEGTLDLPARKAEAPAPPGAGPKKSPADKKGKSAFREEVIGK